MECDGLVSSSFTMPTSAFCSVPGDHASPEVASAPARPAHAAALRHHGPGSQVDQWRITRASFSGQARPLKRWPAVLFLWTADLPPRAGGAWRREALTLCCRNVDNSGNGGQFCSCVLKCVFFFFFFWQSWVICFLLRKLLDVLKRLSVSESFVSSLWFRYFSPGSSAELESALSDSEAWLGHGFMDNPFLGLLGTAKQRGLRTVKGWWSIFANPNFAF